MNASFLLVLSILLQLIFSSILKLLFPTLLGVGWFTYIQVSISSTISIFLPSYLYLKNGKKTYFNDCFEGVKIDRLLLIAVGIGLCAQFVGMVANLPFNFLLYKLNGEITEKIPQIMSLKSLFFGIITLCILPAIFEEVLFRGILFNYFRQFGVKAAIIISALLFSIMHFELGNLFGTFLLGIIFGLLVKYTNRLIYPMIAHFSVNCFATLIKYFSNFAFFENFYNDFILIFMVTSFPLLVYLLKMFMENSSPLSYHDQDQYEHVEESIIEINDTSSIKIFEHDIKENNLNLAFKHLFLSPHIYILILLFIFLEGSKIWGK